MAQGLVREEAGNSCCESLPSLAGGEGRFTPAGTSGSSPPCCQGFAQTQTPAFRPGKTPLLPKGMKEQMPKVACPLAGGEVNVHKLGAKAFIPDKDKTEREIFLSRR